jgi:hypothetical protein
MIEVQPNEMVELMVLKLHTIKYKSASRSLGSQRLNSSQRLEWLSYLI